ncbi:hypothetical protein DOY81_014263, partial [Sarcophaga bullata]
MVKFEVYSGSGHSFLSRSVLKSLKVSNEMNVSIIDDIYIIPYRCTSLIGRTWIRRLVSNEMNVSIIDDIYIIPHRCTSLIGRTWIRRL